MSTILTLRKPLILAVLLATSWLFCSVRAFAEPEQMPTSPRQPAPSIPGELEQDDSASLAPLEPSVATADESPLETQWLEGPTMAAGGMSQWDYYAGSVYANTSPLWVDAEYLLWWISGNSLPPLVTTSPNGTLVDQAGVLGQPNTAILFGNERVDNDARSGFRTSLGVRLGHVSDALMDAEIEGSFFWLGDGQSSGHYADGSLGDPILARPFVNAETGLPDSTVTAFPGIAFGNVQVETNSDLISAGLRFRRSWLRRRNARVDWLLGYRYLRHQEDLSINEAFLSLDPPGSVDDVTEFSVLDEFATWNEFHGVDLGLQWWYHHGNWSAELLTKVAVGGTSQTVEVFGETLVLPPADTSFVTPGGLLALPTNMGRYQSSKFSMLPELGIKLRRRLTHSFVLTLGYTVMVVDHVARSGDQIDTTINTSQIGNNPLEGPARPTVSIQDSNLWVHGFSVGLEW